MAPKDPFQKQLAKAGVRPKKSLGQNFLQDADFASEIVRFGGLRPGDQVLEIGPGTGALTRELLAFGADLTVVEVDPILARELPKNVPGLDRDRILGNDVRSIELSTLFSSPVFVFGNVPYSISTDIIFWTFAQRDLIRRSCFLMQKEFAERIAASPGGRDYGILSVYRELYAEAELGPIIAGDRFFPKAAVDSQVIKLSFRPHPAGLDLNEGKFQSLVRASFGQRRKTLLNSLTGSGKYGTKLEVEAKLSEAGLDPTRRAETLSLQEFVRLTQVLSD